MVRFIIIPIPYEWVERFFGTYIADHFNEISWTLFFLGFLIWALFGKNPKTTRVFYKATPEPQREFKYYVDENGHYIPDLSEPKEFTEPKELEEPAIYQARHGEWSPTGWVYDRDTKKWDPPDYLSKESDEKWRWNEEKGIWIDTQKEKRQEKHKQWRREQGKEPSYEEWKKAKLESERKKDSENRGI